MKPATYLAVALASLASASPLTYAEQCQKYKCLTLDTVENWNPECARKCLDHLANNIDGCAADDFRCHCKRSHSIAPMMRACLTSNSTGCSPEDLGAIGAGFKDMCTYFNETKYEAYQGCTKLLYSFVTFADEH